MCDPVSVGLAVGGTVLASNVAKGVSAEQQGEEAAAAGRETERLAKLAASSAEQAGAFEAGKVQMKGEALMGKQLAIQGSSGAVVGEGSFARTVEDTASLTAIDKQTVLNNAQREAWGIRVQGRNARIQGENAERAGDAALVGGIIGGAVEGAGAGLGAAARVGGAGGADLVKI